MTIAFWPELCPNLRIGCGVGGGLGRASRGLPQSGMLIPSNGSTSCDVLVRSAALYVAWHWPCVRGQCLRPFSQFGLTKMETPAETRSKVIDIDKMAKLADEIAGEPAG